MMETPPDLLITHEWIRWLSSPDATVLLLWLCQVLDQPDSSVEELRKVVHGWRRNALKALTAEDWKASVDRSLEVTVDARAYLLARGQLDE